MESPSQPTMQTIPSCRATTAACEVRAPSTVTSAAASDIAPMSPVSAVSRTRMIGFPPCFSVETRSGSNTTAPIATPALAEMPCDERRLVRRWLQSDVLDRFEFDRLNPRERFMTGDQPFLGKIVAIRSAASGVRFPARDCRERAGPAQQ